MAGKAHRSAAWRGAFLTLAFLALFMKVAAPPGFMVATPGSTASFPLVICTGHGPLTSDQKGGGAQKGDAQKGDAKSKADAPCAFAGHAAPPMPALGSPLPTVAFADYQPPATARFDLAPGRGLAAPPPPSRGPPIRL